MKYLTIIAPRTYPLFFPNTKASFGGAEVQLFQLANELKNQNSELNINVFVADYGQPKTTITQNGLTLINAFNFEKNIFGQFFIFLRLFIFSKHKIVLQRAMSLFTPIIAILCKIKGAKFIYMVAHDTEVTLKHPIYKSKLIALFCKTVFNLADKIIVQNNFQYNHLLKFNNKTYKLGSGYIIPQKSENKNGKYILWIGRSDSWKNPELFLDIVSEKKEFDFYMICTKAKDYESECFNKIKIRAQNLSNCIFKEFIPFHEINTVFENTSILINTSENEGFSNTFIQSAMNYVPVLSLNSNPNNIYDDGKIGFCFNGNIIKLKEKIDELIMNPSQISEIGEEAYKYSLKNHSIDQITKDLMKILEY
jgi:glycosyltransferase involved in cell wall biosynthesis